MNLYQFILPTEDHNGKSYNEAHRRFKLEAIRIAGGYTEQGSRSFGAWQGPDKIYHDKCNVYQIACTPSQCDDIVSIAFKLFPDQLAIMYARIGEATIAERPKAQHHPVNED
jgi:hypothetical protein